MEVELSRQEPELFQHKLGTLKADAVHIVLELVADVFFHFLPANHGFLDRALDGQEGVATGKAQDFVGPAKKILGLIRGDLVFFLGWLAGLPWQRFLLPLFLVWR